MFLESHSKMEIGFPTSFLTCLALGGEQGKENNGKSQYRCWHLGICGGDEECMELSNLNELGIVHP